ncbi:hypothetical protein PMIN01_06906 [Paraphaeosphaeria minitans]|uniref:Uncharacterized protein n=1 Tax=Paraphaeosphaeria minitans TaxID=565426 RepID=A0A9P6GGZ3_9PLEO|nr:hypothetical protein PMIN01_06906 [Paraphaeosphaeria minitans]
MWWGARTQLRLQAAPGFLRQLCTTIICAGLSHQVCTAIIGARNPSNCSPICCTKRKVRRCVGVTVPGDPKCTASQRADWRAHRSAFPWCLTFTPYGFPWWLVFSVRGFRHRGRRDRRVRAHADARGGDHATVRQNHLAVASRELRVVLTGTYGLHCSRLCRLVYHGLIVSTARRSLDVLTGRLCRACLKPVEVAEQESPAPLPCKLAAKVDIYLVYMAESHVGGQHQAQCGTSFAQCIHTYCVDYLPIVVICCDPCRSRGPVAGNEKRAVARDDTYTHQTSSSSQDPTPPLGKDLFRPFARVAHIPGETAANLAGYRIWRWLAVVLLWIVGRMGGDISLSRIGT